LEPVAQFTDEAERDCAQRLASAQRRLADAERRCRDLRGYLEEYQNMFAQRARAGMGVAGMRDYQTFIARLTEGVQAQQQNVEQLGAECERERARWLEAAVRKNAVGKVIAQARSEDRKAEERQMQHETDERAQRMQGAQ
jgi:flagellar export protein FliJ